MPVFDFRSFTGLRTKWERRTGGDSQISSPCRWRNGWQPSTGCNCSHNRVPHHWGQFYRRFSIWDVNGLCCALMLPLFFSAQVIDYGRQNREPLLPREHVTLYWGEGSAWWGEGKGCGPLPDLVDGVGGRWELQCSEPLCTDTGGKGLAVQKPYRGRKIHVIASQPKNNEIHHILLLLFSIYFPERFNFCHTNYWKDMQANMEENFANLLTKHLLFNFLFRWWVFTCRKWSSVPVHFY